MPRHLRSGLALSFMLVAVPLDAQSVHPGITVRVRAPSVLFERLEGVYLGRDGDTLVFGNEERAPTRVPMSAITQLEISRGKSRWAGAGRGAMWGALTMALLGAVVVYAPDYDEGVDGGRGAFIGTMAVGGAEIGAIIGAFVPKRKWVEADPRVFLNAASARRVWRELRGGFSF